MPSDSRVLLVASEEYAGPLQAGGALGAINGLNVLALTCDAVVAPEWLSDASLLVIETAPDNAASLQRLAHIRKSNPDLVVLAAVRDANLSLVRSLLREGVADIVPLPFEGTELLSVILDNLARERRDNATEVALAPVFAIARSIGGCGATTLATHLAADLAAHDPTGRGTVILDLDLQYGSVAEYLGISTDNGIENLLEAGSRLDDELIRSVAVRASDGIAVVAAPQEILPLEAVDTEQLMRIIAHLRREYAHVILDLPADWTNWTLSAALSADVILLVVELSVGSLRQAKRRLDLFRSVGVSGDSLQIVVNKVEKRLFRTIDVSDVSDTLSAPVIGSIAQEAPLVANSQTQGQLVGQIQRKSRFVADIAKIGDDLRQLTSGRRQ